MSGVHAPEPRSHPEAEAQAGDTAGGIAEVARSPGSPLSAEVRTQFESQFGTRFGDVRLHTDAQAGRTARALDAVAFTWGSHIGLDRAQVDPDGASGRWTIAHELTHVLQQRRRPPPGVADLRISSAADVEERAADHVAEVVVDGRSPTAALASALAAGDHSQSGPRVHRQRRRGAETTAVAPPAATSATLDAGEAADLVTALLFDSGGYFAALRAVVDQFQRDVTTDLGWYSGSRREGDPRRSAISNAVRNAVRDRAKELAKKALGVLLQGLSGGLVAAGPAGTAAGVLRGIIADTVGDVDAYRATIVEEAVKPAHQQFVELIRADIDEGQDRLRERWLTQRTESIDREGLAGLRTYIDRVRAATADVRRTFYVELTEGFLPLARRDPSAAQARPVTPYALYTGVPEGFVPFAGSRESVTPLHEGDLYVELAASGYAQSQIHVVRTLAPSLPSHVAAQLNTTARDLSLTIARIPFRRLIIEATSPDGPGRVVVDSATLRAEPSPTVHYAAQFCRNVATAAGNTGNTTLPGERFTTLELTGASLLYTWVLTTPLADARFGA